MSLRTSDGPSTTMIFRPCHCFIKHAVTRDEIAAAGGRLEEARRMGDINGIIIALGMLTGSCPAKSSDYPTTDQINR